MYSFGLSFSEVTRFLEKKKVKIDLRNHFFFFFGGGGQKLPIFFF